MREGRARHGLNPWAAVPGCLVRGYRPEQQPFVMEAMWPQVRIVAGSTDSPFFHWLLCKARNLGLYVIQRGNGIEALSIWVPAPPEPDQPLTDKDRPPLAEAFWVRVETPPVYPPEAAAELHRWAQQKGRELLRSLGYTVPRRMRRSRATVEAPMLRLEKPRLGRRETGDIAEELYGKGAAMDPKRRKRVRDQRHRLRNPRPPS